MTLQGHVKGIMALDFSPCGHLLASGSEDHAARLWELRKRRCIYTLPCHTSLVSQVCAFGCGLPNQPRHHASGAGYMIGSLKLNRSFRHQLLHTI